MTHLPACRPPERAVGPPPSSSSTVSLLSAVPRMRMQPLACALKPLVVNMNSILSIAADMKYPTSSSQQLKTQGHIFAGDAENV